MQYGTHDICINLNYDYIINTHGLDILKYGLL